MERVAFIGLGAIGRPMCRRLLDDGFKVTVFDVVSENNRELVERGASEAESPKAAVQEADAAVVMVATAGQAQEAILGEGGVSSSLPSGSPLILCSTVGPGAIRQIHQRLGSKDKQLLDAPVSGGTARARTGELLIMASGVEDTLALAQPIFESLGSKTEWISQNIGDGQSMKLVNQLLCGVHLAAAGEALAFAQSLGLDPVRAYDVVRQGAANSFMLDDRAQRMLSDGPVDVESALDIFVKDTGLVLEAAQENEFRPDLTVSANSVFREGSEAGMWLKDDSCVKAIYRMRRTL